MAGQPSRIFFPENYQELFSLWETHKDAALYAGGTSVVRENRKNLLNLPAKIISLEKIDEMQKISRSERYMEIGATVKLSRIIDLGKMVPEILRDCLKAIDGMQLRNMATIGGNICFAGRQDSSYGIRDSTAILSALEAQYELRTAQNSRWISALRFSSVPVSLALEPNEVLSRIRVPLDNWDFAEYKKFTRRTGNAAVFLAKMQKNIISDIRIIYKTDLILRDRNSESILNGKRLPISRRIAADFIEHCEEYLSGTDNVDELSKKEMINFVERNVYSMAE